MDSLQMQLHDWIMDYPVTIFVTLATVSLVIDRVRIVVDMIRDAWHRKEATR